jgi:hypothetical protein
MFPSPTAEPSVAKNTANPEENFSLFNFVSAIPFTPTKLLIFLIYKKNAGASLKPREKKER